MISRLHLSMLVFLVAIFFGVSLLVTGVAVKISWLTRMAGVVTVLALFLLGFDHWIWSWRWLHPWFVARPNLNGTWKLTFQNSWVNPDTGEKADDIEAYLVVRQRFSHLSIRQFTAESSSKTVASSILRADDGVYEVHGVYRNEPKIPFRDRSALHYGALRLEVKGDPPSALQGNYWTDRKTIGTMTTEGHLSEVQSDFTTAKRAFEAQKAKAQDGENGAASKRTDTSEPVSEVTSGELE